MSFYKFISLFNGCENVNDTFLPLSIIDNSYWVLAQTYQLDTIVVLEQFQNKLNYFLFCQNIEKSFVTWTNKFIKLKNLQDFNCHVSIIDLKNSRIID